MALNGTMVKIETVTVGSGGAANITFSNIPQTYTDLMIKISLRGTYNAVGDNIVLDINSKGNNTGITRRSLYGTGSAAVSNQDLMVYTADTATASTFGSGEIYFPNYTGSTNKSFSADTVSENNGTTAYTFLTAGLWSYTEAITSIKLTPAGQPGGNWSQHSTATLYGISRTTAQIKATGGMVYDDASYTYHVFLASGTFTPTQNLTCDVLTIAGGGGGGYVAGGNSNYLGGGGGGAGGLKYSASQSLTAQNYTVTVGAGGAASTNGNNSVFGSMTATGGGRGATPVLAAGNGGSGGGAQADNPTVIGTGTSGEGNNGGQGFAASFYSAGGGGGGAGAVGSNATGTLTGAGGNGVSTYSSWGEATNTGQNINGTRWYAGGGSGGAYNGATTSGGNGGGGVGSGTPGNPAPTSGTANTGGGGGGMGLQNSGGGSGGSGIVIVRYAK